MTIRQLPEKISNQIAAGEVIERPASVVKELVENALDAGATRVEIATAGGGLNLIRVTDNGSGIRADELELAVSRHCTSKLGDDIHDIRTLGFRGEALPSIGSVARLTLRSRVADASSGAEIRVDAGRMSGPFPAPANVGTIVEVGDLFHATPARLKFMKTVRAETQAITETVKRIAIAAPGVHFLLSGTDRSTLDIHAAEDRAERVAAIAGRDFIDNAVEIDAVREGVRIGGLAAIPSFHRANSLAQYVHVNGRPVRDRQIAGAIRAAYADLMARDRHPVVALFIECDPSFVDVNVHPAKADVRFRDAGLVRGLIIGAIRQALGTEGIRGSTTRTADLASAFRMPESAGGYQPSGDFARPRTDYRPDQSPFRPLEGFGEQKQARFEAEAHEAGETAKAIEAMPLGAARAQLHENYIVAQTEAGMVIVDQHAAHERLVYEHLKGALDNRAVPSQMLLIPEIVDLPEEDCERIEAASGELGRFGLVVERFGPGAVAVRETPSMLGKFDVAAMVRDVADELAETETTAAVRNRLDQLASRIACHGSVRSGRRMSADEMNALLRQMEATPGSGTCNHGRPTFIELSLSDIEKLFGRR